MTTKTMNEQMEDKEMTEDRRIGLIVGISMLICFLYGIIVGVYLL